MDNIAMKREAAERYELRSDGEWAHIFIDETKNAISIISSFGNWGYIWGRPGCTFKEFIVKELCRDYDYFLSKILNGQEEYFDVDETIDNLKKEIIRRRRKKIINKMDARDAWVELEEHEHNAYELFMQEMYTSRYIENVFGDWDDLERFTVKGYDPGAVRFCEIFMPVLKNVLQKENMEVQR